MSEYGENALAEKARPEAITKAACRQCLEFLDASDNFCRYCGAVTEHGAKMVTIDKLPPRATREPAARPPSWIENPLVVLLALFVVLGPLALPMLWHSRQFTRGWKIGLTLGMLLATVAAVWYGVAQLNKALDPLVQELRRASLP